MQQSAHGSTRWHSLQISSSQMQITLALIKQVYRSLFLLFTFLKLSVLLSSTLFPYLSFPIISPPLYNILFPYSSFPIFSSAPFFFILPLVLFHLHLRMYFSLWPLYPPLLYPPPPPQQYNEGQLSRADASLSFLIFERMS